MENRLISFISLLELTTATDGIIVFLETEDMNMSQETNHSVN